MILGQSGPILDRSKNSLGISLGVADTFQVATWIGTSDEGLQIKKNGKKGEGYVAKSR